MTWWENNQNSIWTECWPGDFADCWEGHLGVEGQSHTLVFGKAPCSAEHGSTMLSKIQEARRAEGFKCFGQAWQAGSWVAFRDLSTHLSGSWFEKPDRPLMARQLVSPACCPGSSRRAVAISWCLRRILRKGQTIQRCSPGTCLSLQCNCWCLCVR